jgi:phospholipid/cholesterol/gamma-HCH transport system substrate-binding protein
MSSRRPITIRWTTMLVAIAMLPFSLLLGGCDLSLRSLPYPGPARGNTFQITGEFANALNLPVSARVKWQGLTVGEVTAVEARDYVAIVTMKIIEKAEIPTNVRAEIRLSSPMGESFVDLLPPTQDALVSDAVLRNGDRIGLEATMASPDVNNLMATAATVMNGGVFADLNVIITQLNTGLKGNTGAVRSMLNRLDHSLRQLNARTDDFDRALTSIDAAVADPDAITSAIDDLPTLQGAVDVLAAEQPQITALAKQVRRLGANSSDLLRTNRSQMLTLFRSLAPVLDVLTRNADTFGPLLDNLSKFGKGSLTSKKGWYNNFDLTGIIDLDALAKAKHVDPHKVAREWER